jgi:ABC-2 type transport system ATP-binding protein
MISINNLSKSYGSKIILRDINVEFQSGNIYGIVGENGAGKTTLFRCIAGLEKYEGEISSDSSPLKNNLGLLLTDAYFFPKMTGLEYLHLMCDSRNLTFNADLDIHFFDLPLNEYASIYSTGMKKKLALLGVLLQNNTYYILDEPFNGVDIQSNIIITEIIHQLKALNKTVLLSSHIFSTLRDNCDEIYVLKDGTFSKKVNKSEFEELEIEMKAHSKGIDLKSLGLK